MKNDPYMRKWRPIHQRSTIGADDKYCPKCEDLSGNFNIKWVSKNNLVEFFRNRPDSFMFHTDTEGFICDCPTCDFEWWEYIEE